MKEQPKQISTAEARDYQERPTHKHRCAGPAGGQPHEWECSSPYCESTNRRCPDDGGNAPFFDL